jgi:hypothetical protein
MNITKSELKADFQARRIAKRIIKWSVIILVVIAFLGAMHYDHKLLEAGLIN